MSQIRCTILTHLNIFCAKMAEKAELIKIIEKEHEIWIYRFRNMLGACLKVGFQNCLNFRLKLNC